ncbi:MAG: lycopene cyclase domain-containing protein [Actinomycetota bacterium]|nr:lycopene cyclase domain-containing protein [Actinomycetota bacterium]MDA8208795.1 lycopene cyclase domain-containing protein [Actinomycetota bacterium]
MHAYTIGAIAALLLALVIDLGLLRTRVVRRPRFWIAALIVEGFQIPVDGWLTKLSAPVVIYDPAHFSGVRVFFSSPIEDFVYGLALLILTISIWDATGRTGRRAGVKLNQGGRA